MGKLARITHVLLRVVAGGMFLSHGIQKLFGALGGASGDGAKVALLSQMGAAGILEFVGGLLIVVGLFTRPVALVLAGEMAVAYFTVHAAHSWIPLVNHGELAVLYCFTFLWFAGHGSGGFSLDQLFGIQRDTTRIAD